ncbi:Tn3 family transposase [Roseateles puraquae]|uniref:Tn3 family transposase n=1 Tax=Roseateles puraquae TaxID=431059 RepID=A0A254N866_9BURK|nr:Tn3 family transposase [Roseateles puraquae]MDG0854458.1 Tn3 family transposase [Roseateles puraquae]OWR00856.1 Tn3 family transposase [Roseateles puraquae]
MEHWRIPYLGQRRLPSKLEDFELTTFFTFNRSELACIGQRQKPLFKLAVALQIGFIRMSGITLDAVDNVPKRLWRHLADQIGVQDPPDIASLASIYAERPRTLADHQQTAYEKLGFSRLTEHQRRYVVRWLRETLQGRAGVSSLLGELKQWFYEHRILLIADRELKRLISQAHRDQEQQLGDELIKTYSLPTLDQWAKVLTEARSDGTPVQSWLWSPPIKQSTVQISHFFEKIEYLTALGVAGQWPAQINESATRFYGQRRGNRPPSISARITGVRRTIEVGCFLRYALCTASDQMLEMLRRWIRKMVNKAGKETAPQYNEAQGRLRKFAQGVRDRATNKGLTEAELREQLVTLADEALKQSKLTRAALGREWLVDNPRQARAMLKQLLDISLESDGEHPVIMALERLREIYASKGTELPPSASIDLGSRWRAAINGTDRKRALAAFEWATLLKLRLSLRNGSVFLAHSFKYRGYAALLIPKDEWQVQRNHHYGHLKAHQDPKEQLAQYKALLRERLDEFAKAVQDGRVRVDTEGIHLEHQPVSDEDKRVAELRRALHAQHAEGQISDMMLHVDSKVRYSWHLLGREPNSRDELLLAYASAMNLSTAMSAAEVARMIPGMTAEAVRSMTKRLCSERQLRASADAVFQYMQQFEIAGHWGRADLASSDMMSLEIPRNIWQARADPRRRTASMGVYTHAHDRWGFFYDQPVVLNRRQVGVAIEGVVRQRATNDIAQLAVDTHGFTYFGMLIAKLLRFDLCPRLADLKSRRLHVPVDFDVPEILDCVVDRDLDEAEMEAHHDEHVRIAASIYTGHCSAVLALERYGSDARGQPAYDAGVQIGKLLTTIYLLDYFINPAFRSEVQHALNRGESMHTLQRAIHDGQVPSDLAKREETLAGVSSALSLMSNIVMAWNTEQMQAALDRIREAGGQPATEHLRRIAPTAVEGINFRGTFDFPVEKYAERIMPSTAAAAPRRRGWANG